MNKELPKLIGIHGHAGVGKSTVASYINEWYQDCYIESFADSLKAAASLAFGIPERHFHNSEVKELDNPYWNVSPRKIAQFFGTEMFRQTVQSLVPNIDDKFWIKRLEGKLSGQLVLDGEGEYNKDDCVIVPDVRFQNEYNWIMDNDGVVLFLSRDGRTGNVGISNHSSEAGITITHTGRTYEIINNSSIGDLYNAIDTFIETFPYLNLVKKSS